VQRWWLVLLVGCYRPAAYDECNLLCGEAPGRVCPSGLTCDENGVCKPVGMAGNCPPREAGVDDIDAPRDAFVAGQTCFGNVGDFFRTCLDRAPTTDLELTGPLNTNDPICTLVQPQALSPMVCVIAARNITVPSGATVRVTGQMPLALFATNAIVISGTVDASSQRLGNRGAGANVGVCPAATPGNPAVTIANGAGGGAGGALGGAGGPGGDGAGGSTGGPITPDIALLQIRGGCPGARGGNPDSGNGGMAGSGGGAIYFMAINTIDVTTSAVINASGAGGTSSDPRGGGGGGGSGGFIGFHSNNYTIDVNARIFAIGGGASAGGGGTSKGNVGEEAIGPASTSPSPGMDGGGTGAGGTAAGGGGGGGGSTGGGGGGGGGGGVIGFEGNVPVDIGQPVARQL